jgi:hypothetical protein
MSRYTFGAGWQDQDPWPSGAHWEVGWDDERVSFGARLFEDLRSFRGVRAVAQRPRADQLGSVPAGASV